ncbi:trypco2 family protein [Actinomadura monticuli]|uniref:Trypco2 family protein n=1 Tax=Actinomadura monticuli TaxID=3097367 RepID=A0ABV4QE16_9ACTN
MGEASQNQGDSFGIPLSDAIKQLRMELKEAMEEGKDDELKFEVSSIELELNMVIDTRRKMEGKLSLWKVAAGGGRESGKSSTHRMMLSLKPRGAAVPEGSETLIGDDDD